MCNYLGMRSRSLIALPLLIALAGCGGSSSSSSTVGLHPNVSFSTDVTSTFKDIDTYNSGAVTTGINDLSGPTTISGDASTVKVLANVNYRNGTGPFNGFVTITRSDSSALTLRLDGTATLDSGSGNTSFDAKLTVIAGSGTYATTTGAGSFTGLRTTALGGAVHMDVLLELH